jgi:AraC-like DNA-binding protein
MSAAENSLYTVAVTLCVFLAGLLRRRESTRWSFGWLTWFLVLVSAAFALELLMAHPDTPLKGLWLGLRLGTALLIAPCLWLAVREIAESRRPRLAELGQGNLAALAIGWLLIVPLLEDAHLGTTYNNPDETISWLHARVIHTGMLGCIGIFAVQAPLFLWRCRSLLLERARARDESLRWLELPLAIVAATWTFGLVRTVQCAAHAPKELAIGAALAEAVVAVGVVYLLARRLPWIEPATKVEIPHAQPVPLPALVVSVAPALVEKYARSSLDAPVRQRIRGKIEAALAEQALYRDSLLNLRSFSRAINEKSHYVSQVINQDLGTTFYGLVSRHRIAEARQILREFPERTVLEIALTVGFNSKSTFNTAFRKETGLTPTAFRANADSADEKVVG